MGVTKDQIEKRPTVCTLDCPDTCSLSVSVQNDEIVGIRGSKANPFTDNAICSKVARFFPEYVHGERRLRHPLKRVGPRGSGAYEAISWDAALDLVYQGFQKAIDQYGPQSVLGFNYAGPHGELAGSSLDLLFFHQLGATQLDRGPLCGGVRSAAYSSLFGSAPGMPPEQALESDLILIWGNNASVSNLHFARVARKAQKQGSRIVVIDPKRIPMAETADLYLSIQPGTDVVFAMAMAAEIERRHGLNQAFMDAWVDGQEAYMAQARQFTREQVETVCGVSLSLFDALVTEYLAAQNVALSIGNGIERGQNGGSAIRAIMALQALTGQFGRVGAGVIAKPGLAFPKQSERVQRPDLLPKDTRTLSIIDVSTAILDESLAPPIRAMMIYNHNPIATHPDQLRMKKALSQESLFIVGCDVVMTDSMQYADVILPAASMFEIEDIYGAYGHSYLQRSEAVIPLQGESLPNTEIFRKLARRFGFDNPEFSLTDKQLMDLAFLDNDPRLQGYLPSQLPLDKALLMNTRQGEPLVMCGSVQPATTSGKIELFDAALDKTGFGVPKYVPVESSEAYPLMIISPSSDDRTNATFGGSEAALQQRLEIHPDDASSAGIVSGDEVRVWNPQGEVFFTAKVTDGVRRGVLYTPKGAWLTTSKSGLTVNALISTDARTDISGGACYNDTFVAMEAVRV